MAKQFLCTIIIVYVFDFTIFSQKFTIDSLKNILPNQNDDQKINTYCEISKEFYSLNGDSAIFYANLALSIAEKSKKSELYPLIYNTFGIAYYGKRDLTNSEKYFNTALEYAKKQNDYLQIGNAYNGLGSVYQYKTEYDTALILLKKAAENFHKIDNHQRLGRVYDNIGIVYFLIGDKKQALNNYLKAKEYVEKDGNPIWIGSIYYKISAIYLEAGNYQDAERYALKSLDILKKTKYYIETIRALNTLGILYKEQKKYQTALKYYLEALNLNEKINNPQIASALHTNIGNIYKETGNNPKAKEHLTKAMQIAKQNNLLNNLASATNNLALVESNLGNYSLAEQYFLQSLTIYEKIKEYSSILNNYKNIYDFYKKQEKYNLSLKYLEKYIDLKDSLRSVQQTKTMDSLMTIFKTKEFENQNTILSKENEIKNKTIQNQKLFIYSSIIVLTLITLLTFIVLRSKSKIKTAYNLIKEKNEEISKQSEEIRMMYDQLLELNNFKEGVMHMIVHDMKNPLNNLINIEIFKNEQQRLYITKHTSLMMLNLVQDLLDIYKYQDTHMKLQLEDISAFEIIDNIHRDLILLLDEKSITLQKEITPGLVLHCDKNITSRIFANLLINAIKYSPLNSQIIIESIPLDNFVKFRIIDFGEGIPEKYLDTVFEKFVQLQAKNEKVRSTGLGLTFCKLAIESHGGTIVAKKEEGKGGVFEFTLPLSQKKIDYNAEYLFNKKHFVLTQEEIQLLSQYYEKLKNTPLYKISAINQIIEEIRNTNNSSQINIWTEKLYMAAISANTKEFDAILSLIKN